MTNRCKNKLMKIDARTTVHKRNQDNLSIANDNQYILIYLYLYELDYD